MSHVDNALGNILIKHNDRWRGDYYLKDNLTFTTDKSAAARFYLLKPGDTTILNGDRITINSGNRTICLDNNHHIKLLDRDQHNRGVHSFIVTNGFDNTDPISYETKIYLISDKEQKRALKYEWGMDLISESVDSGVSTYMPRDFPSLINEYYGGTCEMHIDSYEFLLEKADAAITTVNTSRSSVTIEESTPTGNRGLEGYKGAIMVVLLMIVLILCLIISK